MERNGISVNMENCIGDALLEIIKLQNLLSNISTPYLGSLLGRLFKVDTIPFMLFTKKGIYNVSSHFINNDSIGQECFTTSFFRVNSFEKGTRCANITLLRPFDINNRPVTDLCEVYRLEKTPFCTEIDLSCICGLQCLDTDLLMRKIIIEPKW
ncbi:hypothetical protein KHA94_21405 [Bacillus sp. FJAT-49705]|uniref:Spore coat protein Z n=1 Tax=Cytobacillus citreus TaxID=2833586 RepID=A0ABS5NXY1_9BACI|nr:CotY/CotZ family spore coat protein [Cytobacillus citreus]MBS4192702.1 hypothetical protein [Cytobacillus citreus]